MFTVALIGPDGAGKTTIARKLEEGLPLAVKYLYMGVSADASNHMLPTTRLLRSLKRACGVPPDTRGPRPHETVRIRSRQPLRNLACSAKSILSLTVRLSEEWFRQCVVWFYLRRQFIVLFDRHYFPDYYAYDIAQGPSQLPLARRIHGFLLAHVYPKPDLIIYLDAPADVLLARKQEGTLELLERRRKDYLQLQNVVRHFVTIDASRSTEDVARDVSRCVREFYTTRSVQGP